MPGRRGVVIGASAGGVVALGQLLPRLRAGTRTPVFVVLHIPPDRPSLLADIFSRSCALPAKEAEDKEPVAPGTIYFAPPDYHLLLDHGPDLVLSADPPVGWSRPSVDVLFETAAAVYRERLVAIVLTGGSDDGAAGAAAVAAAGGRVIVQSPDEAEADLMPRAALQRVPGATVMTLAEIGGLLARIDD